MLFVIFIPVRLSCPVETKFYQRIFVVGAQTADLTTNVYHTDTTIRTFQWNFQRAVALSAGREGTSKEKRVRGGEGGARRRS